jgi:hypothetical protein
VLDRDFSWGAGTPSENWQSTGSDCTNHDLPARSVGILQTSDTGNPNTRHFYHGAPGCHVGRRRRQAEGQMTNNQPNQKSSGPSSPSVACLGK